MKKIAGIAFVLLSVAIMSVSAFVYEQAQQTVAQHIIDVATISLKSSNLGDLEEGETKSYDKTSVPELGAAIALTTSKSVLLRLASDIDALSGNYTNYTLAVKCSEVPVNSTVYHVGDLVMTLSLSDPDPAPATLDVGGSWVFDFELTTTAGRVATDMDATATIDVTIESI